MMWPVLKKVWGILLAIAVGWILIYSEHSLLQTPMPGASALNNFLSAHRFMLFLALACFVTLTLVAFLRRPTARDPFLFSATKVLSAAAPDVTKVNAVISALEKSPDRRCRKLLRSLISRPVSPVARREALYAMARLKERDAVRPLIELWRIEPESREESERTLIALDRLAIADLIRELTSDDVEHRARVIKLLGKLMRVETDSKVVSLLLSIADAHDQSCLIRVAAVQALSQVNATKLVPNLTNLSRDSDPAIQLEAVAALGKLSHPDVVTRLAEIAHGSDERLRIPSINALGLVKDDGRVAVLKALLERVNNAEFGSRKSNRDVGTAALKAFAGRALTSDAQEFLRKIRDKTRIKELRDDIDRRLGRVVLDID